MSLIHVWSQYLLFWRFRPVLSLNAIQNEKEFLTTRVFTQNLRVKLFTFQISSKCKDHHATLKLTKTQNCLPVASNYPTFRVFSQHLVWVITQVNWYKARSIAIKVFESFLNQEEESINKFTKEQLPPVDKWHPLKNYEKVAQKSFKQIAWWIRLLNRLGFLWKNPMILFFDSCVISIFTMLTISYSPIAKYNTKRKRVSHNMGLTFQITSKCKGHLATLTCKNAKKNRYNCPE